MSPSFLVSLWDGRKNVATLSTTDEDFADTMKKWGEELGYRVEIHKNTSTQHGGPEHK
jgi:hypothetical protein